MRPQLLRWESGCHATISVCQRSNYTRQNYMRLGRVGFILLAIYFVFIGGSAYYNFIFQIKILHHIVVAILAAIWLIGRVRRGIGFPRTPLNTPILGAVAVWIISAAVSIDPRIAFENLWFSLTHVIFFFVLVDLFQRRKERLVMEALFMVCAVVILLSGIELASWYFGLGIIPGTGIGWADVIGAGALLPLQIIRLSLAMNISTLLAGFVAPLVTVTAAWALTARRRDYRIALWLLAGALLIVLVLTFSRGGLLSILTAVGVCGILRLQQMRRIAGQKYPVRLIAGAAVFAGLVAISLYTILSITQARSANTGDAGRLDMWQSAAEMTRDRLITGVGPGLYGQAFRSYRDPTIVQDKLASAHNAYLNTAAETGIIGLAVSLWLAVTCARAWYRNWRGEQWPGRRLRLEAALAALLGIGVHSLVDVFTVTPIVLVVLLLAAYCITERTPATLQSQSEGKKRYSVAMPIIALIALLGYGLWFFQLDRAQSRYMNSLRDSETALTSAREAANLDPTLKLYPLQVDYLTAQATLEDANPDLDTAAQAYQHALELEPTWDVGWINLAAIELRRGDQTGALTHLDRARQINTHNLASLHWAELAEELQAAPDEEIVDAYLAAIQSTGYLPLSSYWWETKLRRAAVEAYIVDAPLDNQYRILTAHDPEHAQQLVPETPITTPEYWVAGEYALTVEQDAQKAQEYFTQAIELAPTIGDYYASRARATLETAPSAARRDLDLASLLGTFAEYPNAIRAKMANSQEEANRLRANALPPKTILQEFAGVLYGRPAQFDVFTQMQAVGPGRAAMQPWYELAENYETGGDRGSAIRVYQAILEYAPDEQGAREKLQHF
jgi:O-antigen ligase/tetratricopeptide (TPR) repeat protein